jgi:hypothetical protein
MSNNSSKSGELAGYDGGFADDSRLWRLFCGELLARFAKTLRTRTVHIWLVTGVDCLNVVRVNEYEITINSS